MNKRNVNLNFLEEGKEKKGEIIISQELLLDNHFIIVGKPMSFVLLCVLFDCRPYWSVSLCDS
jgi:hypothetical protein